MKTNIKQAALCDVHDKIIELLDKITAEQEPKKLPPLVRQLNQLLVDEIATLTGQLESRIAS